MKNKVWIGLLLVLFFSVLIGDVYGRGQIKALVNVNASNTYPTELGQLVEGESRLLPTYSIVNPSNLGYEIDNTVKISITDKASKELSLVLLTLNQQKVQEIIFDFCEMGTQSGGKYDPYVEGLITQYKTEHAAEVKNMKKEEIKMLACAADKANPKDKILRFVKAFVSQYSMTAAVNKNGTDAAIKFTIPFYDYLKTKPDNSEVEENKDIANPNYENSVRYMFNCWNKGGEGIVYDGLLVRNDTEFKYPEEQTIIRKSRLFCKNYDYVIGMFFKRMSEQHYQKTGLPSTLLVLNTYVSEALADDWLAQAGYLGEDATSPCVSAGNTCEINKELGLTGFCSDGLQCVLCLEDAHCKANEKCAGNICVEKTAEKPKQPCDGAKENDGCTYFEGESAKMGLCNAKLKCVECLQDSQCEAGEFCSKQKCVPKLQCGNNCLTAVQCASGICEPFKEGGKKYCLVAPGNQCSNNNCCPAGEDCVTGLCKKRGSCEAKADCKADEVCYEKMCKKGQCITNEDCADDKKECKDFKCIIKKEVKEEAQAKLEERKEAVKEKIIALSPDNVYIVVSSDNAAFGSETYPLNSSMTLNVTQQNAELKPTSDKPIIVTINAKKGKVIKEIITTIVHVDSLVGPTKVKLTDKLNWCAEQDKEIKNKQAECKKGSDLMYRLKWLNKIGTSINLTTIELNESAIKELFAEKTEEPVAQKGAFFCAGMENAETGPETYVKYGLNKILWDWDAKNIKADTCNNYFCDATQFMLSTIERQKELQDNLSKIPAEHIKAICEAFDCTKITKLSGLQPIVKNTVIVQSHKTKEKRLYYVNSGMAILSENDSCKLKYDKVAEQGKQAAVKETISDVSNGVIKDIDWDSVRFFNNDKYEEEHVKPTMSIGVPSLNIGRLRYYANNCPAENKENELVIVIKKDIGTSKNTLVKQFIETGLFSTDDKNTLFAMSMDDFYEIVSQLSTIYKTRVAEGCNVMSQNNYDIILKDMTIIENDTSTGKDCSLKDYASPWKDFFEELRKNITAIIVAKNADSTEFKSENGKNELWSDADNLVFNGATINPLNSVYLIGDNFEAEDFKKDFEEEYTIGLGEYSAYQKKVLVEKTYNYLDFSQDVEGKTESGTYLRMLDFGVEKTKDNKIIKGGNTVIDLYYGKIKGLSEIDSTGNKAYSKNPLLQMPFDGFLGTKVGTYREGYGAAIKETQLMPLAPDIYLKDAAGKDNKSVNTLIDGASSFDASRIQLFAGSDLIKITDLPNSNDFEIRMKRFIPVLLQINTNKQDIALRLLGADNNPLATEHAPASINLLSPTGTIIKANTWQDKSAFSNLPCKGFEPPFLYVKAKEEGIYKTVLFMPDWDSTFPSKLEITCAKEMLYLSSQSWGSKEKSEAQGKDPQGGIVKLITADPKKVNSLKEHLDLIQTKQVCVVPSESELTLVWNALAIMQKIEAGELAPSGANIESAGPLQVCDAEGNCQSMDEPKEDDTDWKGIKFPMIDVNLANWKEGDTDWK